MASDQVRGLSLRDYLTVLRRGRRMLILVVVLVVGGAVGASLLETPLYASTSEVLLQPRNADSAFDTSAGPDWDRARSVATEIRVVQSERVKSAVKKQLGSTPKVSVAPAGETDVIEITATNPIPRVAARIANAYAEGYIQFRRTQAIDDLLAAGKEIQTKIDELQKQIDKLSDEIASASAPQKASLQPERDSLVSQQALFRQRLDQSQVDAALKTGGAQLVTSATPSSTPVSPKPVRNGLIALVLGVIIGTAIVFVRDYLDDAVNSKEVAEMLLRDIPILALVPAVPTWRDRTRPMVISLVDGSSPAAEAYRTLRTSLQFIGLEQTIRTIQVTSPSASEGKTTTLANLCVAFRRNGQRVVAIDCDLRRPRLSHFFDVPNDVGFTSVLLGELSLSDALKPIPGDETSYLLPSGPPPPNPSELLGGGRAKAIFDALKPQADILLIDSPPVNPVTDALLLAGRVDATLLVITLGVTTRSQLKRAIELLQQVEAPLVGCVLNGIGTDEAYAYIYEYVPSEVQRAEQLWSERAADVTTEPLAEPASAARWDELPADEIGYESPASTAGEGPDRPPRWPKPPVEERWTT